MSIRYVNRVLQFGASVPSVPDSFVEDLRSRLNDDDVLYLSDPGRKKKGKVRIDRGPLKNFIGKVVNASDRGERICILLDFLGRQVAVKVAARDISIVENQFA